MKNKKNLFECKDFVDVLAEWIFMYGNGDRDKNNEYEIKIEKVLKEKGFINENVRRISAGYYQVKYNEIYRVHIAEYSDRNSYNNFEVTREYILSILNK